MIYWKGFLRRFNSKRTGLLPVLLNSRFAEPVKKDLDWEDQEQQAIISF
jgi:hypothetical protein